MGNEQSTHRQRPSNPVTPPPRINPLKRTNEQVCLDVSSHGANVHGGESQHTHSHSSTLAAQAASKKPRTLINDHDFQRLQAMAHEQNVAAARAEAVREYGPHGEDFIFEMEIADSLSLEKAQLVADSIEEKKRADWIEAAKNRLLDANLTLRQGKWKAEEQAKDAEAKFEFAQKELCDTMQVMDDQRQMPVKDGSYANNLQVALDKARLRRVFAEREEHCKEVEGLKAEIKRCKEEQVRLLNQTKAVLKAEVERIEESERQLQAEKAELEWGHAVKENESQQQISDLTSENQGLRQQVATLEVELRELSDLFSQACERDSTEVDFKAEFDDGGDSHPQDSNENFDLKSKSSAAEAGDPEPEEEPDEDNKKEYDHGDLYSVPEYEGSGSRNLDGIDLDTPISSTETNENIKDEKNELQNVINAKTAISRAAQLYLDDATTEYNFKNNLISKEEWQSQHDQFLQRLFTIDRFPDALEYWCGLHDDITKADKLLHEERFEQRNNFCRETLRLMALPGNEPIQSLLDRLPKPKRKELYEADESPEDMAAIKKLLVQFASRRLRDLEGIADVPGRETTREASICEMHRSWYKLARVFNLPLIKVQLCKKWIRLETQVIETGDIEQLRKCYSHTVYYLDPAKKYYKKINAHEDRVQQIELSLERLVEMVRAHL